MKSMKEIINDVIKLGDEYKQKQRIHEAEHGIKGPISLHSQKLNHLSQATQLLDRKLKTYLNTLPEEQLRKLETLMYFGRGEVDDIPYLHEHLKTTSKTKDDVIRTIREKIKALPDYLTNALRRADESGIDIDESFE